VLERVRQEVELPVVQLGAQRGRAAYQLLDLSYLGGFPIEARMELANRSRENTELIEDEVRRVVVVSLGLEEGPRIL
jgi:hypothetical protein